MVKRIVPVAAFVLVAALVSLAAGVGPGPGLAPPGDQIISAAEARGLIGQAGVVFVDMRAPEEYKAGTVPGAVNIIREEIVVNEPYPNLLPPGEVLADILGAKGIANDSRVVIFDDSNNMEAARLWWTLLVYGHKEAHVVSGGYEALRQAGAPLSDPPPASVAGTTYRAAAADERWIADYAAVEALAENPRHDVILLDTRSRDEFLDGTIPGSLNVDYLENLFDDGTFKPVQHLLIDYKQRGVTADKEIIIYCAVSVRGAQTFLALYNAGYRNLRLYDGAWVEYTARQAGDAADEEAEEEEDVAEVVEEEEPEPAPEEPDSPGG